MSFPKHFDLNEWFIIITSVLVIAVFLLLPRRFTLTQTIVILVFNFFAGATGDALLAAPPYNLYDVMDRSSFGIFDLSTYVFDFPLTAYIVVYFFDVWHLKGILLVGYLLCWAVLTVILEKIADWLNVFSYNHWNIFYSLLVYFIAYVLNITVFIWTKQVTRRYV